MALARYVEASVAIDDSNFIMLPRQQVFASENHP
jgi:hypothetical protein